MPHSRFAPLRTQALPVVVVFFVLGCGGHTRGRSEGSGPDVTEPDVTEPVNSPIIKVSLDDGSACTLRSDGRVACFEIARGFDSASVPVALHIGDSAVDIAGNAEAGAALRQDGSVVTWGERAPNFPPGPFTRIACDTATACGIRPDGTIACSGRDDQIISEIPGDYQQVLLAGGAACGLTTAGELICQPNRNPDVPVAGDLPTLREVSIDPTASMGGCGIDLAGALHCWGYYCPVPGAFAHVAVGYFGACATTIKGELQCWNYRLTAGDCTANPSAIKHPPPPTGTFKQLAASLIKTCAIEASGDNVQCW